MTCHSCNNQCAKFGRDRKGYQRFRCALCRKTFTQPHNGIVVGTYVSMERAASVIRLLVEGNSIRSVERITGMHRDSIIRLLVLVGERCERMLTERINGMAVRDVECDEMWGFVGCKEKHVKENHPAGFGDAYCFVGIERHTKLVLAWHLGRRNSSDTHSFIEKLDIATSGHFQITTDGFSAYPEAIHLNLGTRVSFAQLIKVYAAPRDGEQRYSPPEVINTIQVPKFGRPDRNRISTSRVERHNLSMRMCIRRLTRLTNAFSRKWENLRAALALYFAYYNFVRVHGSLRVTPAIEAGLTDHVWSIGELLEATQS